MTSGRPRRLGIGRPITAVSLALLLAVAAAMAVAVTANAPGRDPERGCLSGDNASQDGDGDGVLVLAGGFGERRFKDMAMAPDTVIDARSARWRGRQAYPVEVDGGSGICLSGGRIRGTWSAQTSWREMHSTIGVEVHSRRPTVEDLRVSDYGDAVRLVYRAQDFEVRRVHLSDIRDDCVEDDWLHSGTIRDSLLDGCYNAFSARTYDGQRDVSDGSDNLLTVERSLVRLQPMARTYNDEGEPGTAGFFKWDPRGPRLSLHDNVFRADQPAGTVGLGIPPGKLASCSGNVMVWLGRGPYPDPLPPCFRITRDVGVWDEAVAQWRRLHPPRHRSPRDTTPPTHGVAALVPMQDAR